MRNKTSFLALSSRRGLLVDLENLAYNRRSRLVSQPVLAGRLRRVLAAAQPVHYVLAVAPRHILRRYLEALLALGVRWQECLCGPDAADAALFDVARELVSHGYQSIVVASGDHYFAELADVAELIVVLPRHQRAARTLHHRAVVKAA